MNVLFCRIAYMNYYNGVSGDTPHNGGSYISANKTGGEIYNFRPVTLFDESDNPTDEVCCFGYVQPSGNEINLERICGCNKLDNSKKNRQCSGYFLRDCRTLRNEDCWVV